MLVNTFITWNEEIYYLDGNGHMAIGWIGFDADAKDTKYDTEINS
jgi:glucan-binding YG repeat protein